MLSRWLLPVCLAVALLACSSGDDGGGAKPFKSASSSSGAPADGDDDDTTVILPPVEATDAGEAPPTANDQAMPFRGILSATPATRFGGVAPHCTYNVTLRNIEMELAITPSGSVIGGTARNSMVESLVGTCASPALGSVPQTFTLATVNATELTFRGTGGPRTSLLVKLTKVGASWEAASTWERTDRTDDLKWVVKSKLTLGPK